MVCARCEQPSTAHVDGACPDGAGTFAFKVNPKVLEFLERNPDLEGEALALAWIEHVAGRG